MTRHLYTLACDLAAEADELHPEYAHGLWLIVRALRATAFRAASVTLEARR